MLSLVIPWPVKYAVIAMAAAALVAFGAIKGANHVQEKWDAERLATERLISSMQSRQAKATVEVVTKYVDRVKVIHDTKILEITKYVTEKSDNGCVVPAGFIWVLNASASGSPISGTSGSSYDTPSGIKMSAVAGSVADNYTSCRLVFEQLVALQSWVKEMRSSE